MTRSIVPLVLALGLAACGPRPAETVNNASAAGPAVNGAAPANTAGAAPYTPATRGTVTLESAGLRLTEGGTARALAFGTPKAQAIAALTSALGRAPDEQGSNDECGQGPMTFATWQGAIGIAFQEDRFVGWDARGPVTTAQGIGIGSTRAQLDAALHPTVEESTLGVEFTAGEMGGLLATTAPTARITDMWGGSTCQFR